MSRRRSEYDDPWWKREHGGMPAWAIVAIVLVIGGIAVSYAIAVAA